MEHCGLSTKVYFFWLFVHFKCNHIIIWIGRFINSLMVPGHEYAVTRMQNKRFEYVNNFRQNR